MAEKDFYKVLGVAETATPAEIKKAYRKLARRFHPDATGGDKAKELRFKEITEAHETLGDEKKRAAYDEMKRNPFAGRAGAGGGGARAGEPVPDLNEILNRMNRMRNQTRAERGSRSRQQPPQQPPPGADGGFSFNDIFSEMFGGQQQQQQQQPPRVEEQRATLDVELTEAALGGEKEISVDGRHLNVKIPAGVTEGETIRLPGRGQHPDLLLTIHEKPNAVFRRRGPKSADIDVELPIDLEIAVAGGKAEVATLEGTRISLTIPAGTTSGKKLRLRGKGARIARTETRGDLYAEVLIQIPASPTDRAKELARELAAELAKTPPKNT